MSTDHLGAQPVPTLDRLLGGVHFAETHRRRVRAPADRVWAAALATTTAEVRLLGPLLAVRLLPTLLRRGGRARVRAMASAAPLLDTFRREGWLPLHQDAEVDGGRAVVAYGAAGRFWARTDAAVVALTDRAAFTALDRPGLAKAAVTLEVHDRGDHCEVITRTGVLGTDPAARRAFGRYWWIIRGPSGLIRRSWLAAIDRRARRVDPC